MSFYFYKNTFVIPTLARHKIGVTIEQDPVTIADPSNHKLIYERIIAAVNEPKPVVDMDLRAPGRKVAVVVATGERSWNSFASKSVNFNVSKHGVEITITKMRRTENNSFTLPNQASTDSSFVFSLNDPSFTPAKCVEQILRLIPL